MGVSKKLRAGLAVSAVLASCQLVGCGSDTVDGSYYAGQGGEENNAGKAGSSQAGKAGSTGHAGSGHAGEAEAGMAGETEMGGNDAGGSSGNAGKGGSSGGGAGGLAGSGGKGGTGGALAGAGGSTGNAGKGGAGGSSSGAGGGVNAGNGGVNAGSGGIIVSAGSGGASAGNGGASAGSGGATGGSAGGPTCGNGVLDAGEICDPKFTKNDCGSDCKSITNAVCLACESACTPSLLTCDTAIGGTTTATVTGSSGAAKPTDPNPVTTAVGSSRSVLCNEVLDCVRDSGCAANGNPALKNCYCGAATVQQCNAGQGIGACKAQLERALEATDFATVSQRVGNTLYGGGVAMKRIDCDQSFCAEDYQGCF